MLPICSSRLAEMVVVCPDKILPVVFHKFFMFVANEVKLVFVAVTVAFASLKAVWASF
jgi:hypothetical protein